MLQMEKLIVAVPFNGGAKTWIDSSGKIAYHEGETIEQYLAANPGFQVLSMDEFNRQYNAFWKSPFKEITADHWNEVLECLPPMQWHDLTKRFNVFLCSEA